MIKMHDTAGQTQVEVGLAPQARERSVLRVEGVAVTGLLQLEDPLLPPGAVQGARQVVQRRGESEGKSSLIGTASVSERRKIMLYKDIEFPTSVALTRHLDRTYFCIPFDGLYDYQSKVCRL